MYELRFCNWIAWSDRKAIANSDCPGVYIVASSSRDISDRRFEWIEPIIYVGMTNATYGLSGRLNQFDATIKGRQTQHGGADRVRLKHPNYKRLEATLFVSVVPFQCDPNSNLPRDLRKMGEVAKFEFACLAEYAERFGRLPEFNDKARSLKFSKVKLR